jgi:hypothetical protein
VEALAKALERRRTFYNALFAETRSQHADLEPEDMLEHLRLRVTPAFAALPDLSPDAADRALEALYRASLQLLSRRLAGRHALGSINATWEQLLPRLAPLLAIAPRRVVALLSNAAFNLDQARSARPAEWLARMLAVAEYCGDMETLVAAGQVAAWRAGLPQFRTEALRLSAELPPAAVSALLGTNGDGIASAESNALIKRLFDNRFSYSSAETRSLTALGVLGGFTGFGGQFTTPPKLSLVEGEMIAHDHDTAWQIHADAFGALLHRKQSSPTSNDPAPANPPSAGPVLGPFAVEADGQVRHGKLEAHFPEIAGASEFVADAELLAVTLPRSHYVYLIAVTQGRPC